MTKNLDELIPSADEVMRKMALAEAEKAAEAFRKHAQVEAQKKAEIDRLAGPSGLSEEEKIQLAAKVIRRAIDSGRTEMLVYRFPNQLCTDHGRAINQREPGWEKILTGTPKEAYQLFGMTTSVPADTRSSSRSSIGRAGYPVNRPGIFGGSNF
jgi:hypothetical protein